MSYQPSSRESSIILLYFLIVGMRLFLNGSFGQLWGAADSASQGNVKAASADVQTAFKHLIILLLVLVVLTSLGDTAAYPLAIGIEVTALLYVLLMNSSNLGGKVNAFTSFIGGK